MQLTATGTGGLEELRGHLDETKASFAYARIRYSNDKESQREKFVMIVWIGPSCKVMRKAKVSTNQKPFHHLSMAHALQISVHTADVKTVLRVYSLEVPAREKDDLKEEPIVVKLRKVCPCGLHVLEKGTLRQPARRLVEQAMMVSKPIHRAHTVYFRRIKCPGPSPSRLLPPS